MPTLADITNLVTAIARLLDVISILIKWWTGRASDGVKKRRKARR